MYTIFIVYIYIYKYAFYAVRLKFVLLSSGYDIGPLKKRIYIYNVVER